MILFHVLIAQAVLLLARLEIAAGVDEEDVALMRSKPTGLSQDRSEHHECTRGFQSSGNSCPGKANDTVKDCCRRINFSPDFAFGARAGTSTLCGATTAIRPTLGLRNGQHV